MKIILIMFLVIFAVTTYAHDCLPKKLTRLKQDDKYIIKTVKGDTYEEALSRLRVGMPQAGFLQKVKAESTRILMSNSYHEYNRIDSSVKADVDMWMKYECKYHGEFYITAIIAKEDVVYAPYPILKRKDLSLKAMRKKCGNQKIMLFLWNIDLQYQYHSDGKNYYIKTIKDKSLKLWFDYRGYDLLCGDSWIKTEIYHHGTHTSYKTWNNKFEQFKVIGMLRGPGKYHTVKDLTLDVWLELTKDI